MPPDLPDLPDLRSFDDMDAATIAAYLKNSGYREIDPMVFRSPDQNFLLRVSDTPDLTSAFCHACQTGRPSEYLPTVFQHATLPGSGLHLCLTENLRSYNEYDEPVRTTLFGQARAVSSLFMGDEMHSTVHRYMAMDIPLRHAVGKIVTCAVRLGKPLRIDQAGDSILFRDDQNGCHTVFARPFRRADDVSQPETCAALKGIRRRFSRAERIAPSSPYWR